MLRIALVADGDPRSPHTNSGVASSVLRALEARDDVTVTCAVSSAPSRFVRWAVACVSWRPDRDRWRNQARKGRLATVARSRARDRKLRDFRGEYDVVLHVRNTYTPTSAPYVAFIDATGSLGQKNWPKWAMSDRDHRARVRLESTYFTHALLVATAGEYVIEELQRTYNQPAAKLASVGGGTSFLRGPEKAFRGGCEVRFLFVGGEFDRKGGRELLGAFRRLRESFPKVTLTIVGPPVPSEAEDGVDWQGFVKDRGRVRALYSSADVFCLPSRWEPYGLAVQEALAHGLPCIVSDQGALPEIVGEAGVVVRVGSEDDIFDAMQKLVHDESYRRSLAAAAPDRLEGRTWGDVTDRLLTAIAGALDASGSSYS